MKNKKIGVLMGGLSAERDVSLNTGNGVFAALQSRGYDCAAIDWREGDSLPEKLSGVDVVWNALHGPYRPILPHCGYGMPTSGIMSVLPCP